MSTRLRERPSDGSRQASLAELERAFGVRLCCFCNAPASAVLVGDEAVTECGILLRRPIKDRNLCLACALALPTQGRA